MVAATHPARPAPPGAEPAWDIARLFPFQGAWDEADYLALDTNHLVEFTDGYIEVLSMPKQSHQFIVRYCGDQLEAFAKPTGLGRSMLAPFRIRAREGKFREPDVSFMLAIHADRTGEDYWRGADLVMEVVSADEKSQERDHQTKRADYAEGGIPEYWIIDPQQRKILVLRLQGGAYAIHGDFSAGQRATSALLDGFSLDVDQVFAAGGI
jgi:Uma2 family endonuclease